MNLRYLLRLTSAFLSRFKVLIGIGVGVGILFFLVLNFLIPKFGGWSEQRIGISGRFTSTTLPDNVLEMIGDGLTQVDKTGTAIPNIASSWESPDKGKTWLFKIKSGLVWQDGKKVAAKDLIYQFSDATESFPDQDTVQFVLQSAYSAFPSVVSRPVFRSGLLGTGEWRGRDLVLNGDYVSQLTLENEKSKQRLIYKFYPTEDAVKLAFELGQVDKIEGLIDSAPLNTWKHINLSKSVDYQEYVAVFFNTGDSLLANKTLRQALSYGTQKDNLGGPRAISPISVNSWAYNSQVKQYAYDLDKGKSMIDTLPDQSKNNLSLTLTTSPILLPQAESIQKDWAAMGVKTNLQVSSFVPTNFQALLAIFDIPSDPDQYSIWHSTQASTNITHYSNPRIDKLLEDGRTTLDIIERKQIYLDFQRFLVEDSPAIFLYYPTTYTIVR